MGSILIPVTANHLELPALRGGNSKKTRQLYLTKYSTNHNHREFEGHRFWSACLLGGDPPPDFYGDAVQNPIALSACRRDTGAHGVKCRMGMMPDKLQQNSALFSDRLWREVPVNDGLASYLCFPRRWQESKYRASFAARADPPQMRARQLANAIEVDWAIDRLGAGMDVILKGPRIGPGPAVPTKQNDYDHRPPTIG